MISDLEPELDPSLASAITAAHIGLDTDALNLAGSPGWDPDRRKFMLHLLS